MKPQGPGDRSPQVPPIWRDWRDQSPTKSLQTLGTPGDHRGDRSPGKHFLLCMVEQTAVRRSHTARVKELEETQDVCVDYQEHTDKWSVELAVGSMVHLDVHVVEHPCSGVHVTASQVQEDVQVIPMSATFAAFTTGKDNGEFKCPAFLTVDDTCVYVADSDAPSCVRLAPKEW